MKLREQAYDAFTGHRVNSIRIRMILGERIGLSARRLPVAIREHEAILVALANRDTKGATAALASHLNSSRRRATHFEAVEAQKVLVPCAIHGAGHCAPNMTVGERGIFNDGFH